MTCCWPWFKSKSTKREKLHSIIKPTVTSTQGVCLRGKNLILKTIDSIKKCVLESAVYLNNGKNVISVRTHNIPWSYEILYFT